MEITPTILFHPGNELFTPLSREALVALAGDIKANGLREAIVFRWIEDRGPNRAIEVVHGRFRLQALELNDAELFKDGRPNEQYFRQFDPALDGDPTQFIVAANIRSRSLYEPLSRALNQGASAFQSPETPEAAADEPATTDLKRSGGHRSKKNRKSNPVRFTPPELPSFGRGRRDFVQCGPQADVLKLLDVLLNLRERLGGSTQQALLATVAGLAAIDHAANSGATVSHAQLRDLLAQSQARRAEGRAGKKVDRNRE